MWFWQVKAKVGTKYGENASILTFWMAKIYLYVLVISWILVGKNSSYLGNMMPYVA